MKDFARPNKKAPHIELHPESWTQLLGCFMKYSLEEKLSFVKLVLEGGHSIRSASEYAGVQRTLLRSWLARYNHYGTKGLSLRRGIYSGKFKETVIRDLYENHLSLSQTAVKYGIASDSTVIVWERIYRDEGAAGLYRDNRGNKMKTKLKKSSKPLTVEEQLREENELLRAEIAYLKKLRALVEERVARESGNGPKPSKD